MNSQDEIDQTAHSGEAFSSTQILREVLLIANPLGGFIVPSYVRMAETGELKTRVATAYKQASPCTLCPRYCSIDRLKGEHGYCQAGQVLKVARFAVHVGEEPAISGTCGSGTVFFSHCSLRCITCQNQQISLEGLGREISVQELSKEMIKLQQRGVHNINLVTPSHYLPWILEAIDLAAQDDLDLPLVYNSSGYENLETLRLLDGVVDIYIPDAKYSDDYLAKRLSNASNYQMVNKQALIEMAQQVGPLINDDNGIAVRGLLVRHLILPGQVLNSKGVLDYIAKVLGNRSHISLMSQYYATERMHNVNGLDRTITQDEYQSCIDEMLKLGFEEGWLQEGIGVSLEERPEFLRDQPIMR
ncbi:MAG: radical SAM protein [Chloroflexota bacterium]|nr:radical SAM protein [Chloroflexota bacterium]